MSLRSFVFADVSRLGTQVATTSGHTCPYLAGKRDIQRPRATRMSLLSAFIRDCRIGIVRAICKLCNTADTWWTKRTPQPTSSERRKAQKTRAAHFRCSQPVVCRFFKSLFGERL